MRLARYYLGRVLKHGLLDVEKIIQAILDPPFVPRGKFEYTFTHARDMVSNEHRIIYARLAKYSPVGEARVVEKEGLTEETTEVPNLLIASSPFVFFPDDGFIAYQHVSGVLEHSQFEKAFVDVVISKYKKFFVYCAIEPISDLMSFIRKLAALDQILEIDATVHPPNPLFGPRWKSLRDYMRRRNADEVRIREKSGTKGGLATGIPDVLDAVRTDTIQSPLEPDGEVVDEHLPIGDAAVLMAVDGYGKATIRGLKITKTIVIQTQETQQSFAFEKDPSAEDLSHKARDIREEIAKKRGLQHP